MAGDNGFLFGGGMGTLSGYLVKCDAGGNIAWQYQYLHPDGQNSNVTCNILPGPGGEGYLLNAMLNTQHIMNIRLDAAGAILDYGICNDPNQLSFLVTGVRLPTPTAMLFFRAPASPRTASS